MDRDNALKQLYRETHNDYKGKINGIETIMVLRNGGSTLVRLDDLTDAEIASRVEGYSAPEPPRPLYRIAQDVQSDIRAGNWRAPGRRTAQPYLNAMAQLDGLGDRYGCDSARSVVLYFLSNAGTWRGATARAVKAELKGMLG